MQQLPLPGPAFYAVFVEALTFLFTDSEGSAALLWQGDGAPPDWDLGARPSMALDAGFADNPGEMAGRE